MIFLWWLLLAIHAGAVEYQCLEEGRIRYRALGKEHEERAAFCFDATRSYFLSQSCKRGDCAAKAGRVCEVPGQALKGNFGSPGFKLCKAVGGEAQIIEFHDGQRWWSMDRCFFASDGSFMDTGLLIERRAQCEKPKGDKKNQI